MAYTLTLDNVTENYKNFIPELQMGIETKILSMRIKKTMDEGKTLEEIVSTYLPNVAIDVIKEDVAALEKGVNKVYAAQDEETDAAWVKSHLNECMLERSDKERVMFLSNIILAERVLHSDIELEEDALTQMKALREADACTAENVNWLLEIANDVLSQHAGMLTQMSWKAMEHTMFQLDYEILEENIVYGKESALAYAAAYYIQQACGKKLKIKNTMNQEMSLPAEVLGNVAAASVESSRLMQLYCTGKIEKKIFFAKINGIYKSVITFICEHKAALVVQTILTVGAFYYMFSLISILLNTL